MEKSKILLGVLVTLLVGIIWLLMSSGRDNISFDVAKFSLSQEQVVDQITLLRPEGKVELKVQQGSWYVNGHDLMDVSLYQVLRSMMEQLKVKRPVSKLSNENIIADLKNRGVEVVFKQRGNEISRFFAGGVASQSLAYFYAPGDDRAYIVEIPGYTSYVSAIFNLTSLQWRNRLMFSTPWQSLKSLAISYPLTGKPTLQVNSDGYFPSVEGLDKNRLDTGKLVNYLDRFANFETNEFIVLDKFPKYDSLSKTLPEAIIAIEDLDISNNQTLKIFPLISGDRVQLVNDGNDEWSVIEQQRIKPLLPKGKDDFLK